jgi:hypothetical protein
MHGYSVDRQLGDLVDVAAWGIVPWGWGFGTRRPSNMESFGKGLEGATQRFIMKLA